MEVLRIASLLNKSKGEVAIFTGAGMSTESGLKDFRSNGGLWDGKNPMAIASTRTIEPQRDNETYDQYAARLDEFVSFYRWRMTEVLKSQPNAGHHILAKWQVRGVVNSIITQNVDNYHQKALLDNTERTRANYPIYPLHGDLMALRCNNCGCGYPYTRYTIKSNEEAMTCDQCEGIVRPNIVLFGESLDAYFDKAIQATHRCSVMVVLGSSLSVSPANHIPMIAAERGASLVIINREPTPLDAYANIVINDRSIGEVLQQIDKNLGT